METKELVVSLSLVNHKVKFEAKAPEKDSIYVDYHAPLGDEEGYTSLELFLISAASCLGTGVKILVKNHYKKDITSLDIKASGVRRKEHPTYFERINLDLICTAPGLTKKELDQVIFMAEKKICPVLCMLKEDVTVNISSQV